MKSRILQAVLIAATVLSVAAPAAFADDDHDHGRRAWREREWREHHHGYYQPGYVYAPPPPVVYAPPPPVVYAPPPVYVGPSFSLTIPLR